MRFRSDIALKIKGASGQATLEAAFMIPVLLTLILLLVQPAIIFYDLIVMNSASSEACRLASESGSQKNANIENLIRRRLSAVPQADLFHIHEGGCTWQIKISGRGSSKVEVSISNKLKAVPLIDVALRAFGGATRNGVIEISATSKQVVQPDWVGKK